MRKQIFMAMVVMVSLAACSSSSVALPITVGTAQVPPGKYLFVEQWTHITGQGKMPAMMIDFPAYRFDPATGELGVYIAPPGTSFKLPEGAIGYLGLGTSRSGAAGGGAASWLEPIKGLPFKTDNLTILAVNVEGTVVLEYKGNQIVLKWGEEWKSTSRSQVLPPEGMGVLETTERISNFGFQDKDKIK